MSDSEPVTYETVEDRAAALGVSVDEYCRIWADVIIACLQERAEEGRAILESSKTPVTPNPSADRTAA